MRVGIDLQSVPDNTRAFTGVSHYAVMLKKYLQSLHSGHELIFFKRRSRSVPFWDAHIRDARLFRKARLDLLHSPAYTTPMFYQGKTVVTVHDLVIYKHPEWFPGGQWFSTKVLVPRSIKRASHIIVPSESTKKDLLEIFNVASSKIHVVPLGVEDRFRKQKTENRKQVSSFRFQVSRPYILCVATLEPRKNIVRLIRAYSHLPKDLVERYDLVIAGDRGWKYQDILLEIKNSKTRVGDRVRLIGAIKNDELPRLYQDAALFCLPSLYEGFGLPVLEALAAGVPVITSNVSSLPEVTGDAAVLVDPYQVEQIANAVKQVLTNPNLMKKMSEQGKEQAEKFTWENAAEKTLSVYEKTAGKE